MNSRSALRVCVVTGSYPPARCGIGDYAHLLCDALAQRGAAVSVITSSYLGTRYSSGNPTVLPIVDRWSLSNVARILYGILKTDPDIIHFQFPHSEYYPHRLFDALVPMVVLLRRRSKIVVTLHEAISIRKCMIPWLFRPFRHWLSTVWADAIIVVAESYKKTLCEISPQLAQVPCKVIPLASNIPVCAKGPEELDEFRRQAGVANGTVVLTYFGFIQPRKGVEQVLDVLRILRNRQVCAELMILGDLSAKDQYHRRLLDQIAEEGLKGSVKVLGHLEPDAIASYLAMSDCCLLPFVDGVHPKRGSFLAAVNQGVLTVTTSREKRGFFRDENVYYASPLDAEDMAAAVQRYVGSRALARSWSTRSWDLVAGEHLDVFHEVLRCRRSGRDSS